MLISFQTFLILDFIKSNCPKTCLGHLETRYVMFLINPLIEQFIHRLELLEADGIDHSTNDKLTHKQLTVPCIYPK